MPEPWNTVFRTLSLKFATIGILIWSACAMHSLQGPVGIFAGALPCSDCTGIACTLTLASDRSFTLERTYIGQDQAPLITSGAYRQEASDVLLFPDDLTGWSMVQVSGDTLILLDGTGDPAMEGFPSKYMLIRQDRAEASAARDGSSPVFQARGNEPFWNLEIFASGRARFRSLGPEELDRILFGDPLPALDPKPTSGASVPGRLRWTSTMDGKPLILEAERHHCEDDMSGQGSAWTVRLVWGDGNHGSGFDLAGCGDIRGPVVLDGAWTLESIDNESLPGTGSRPVTLVFDHQNGKLSGWAGCNTYSGSYRQEDGDRLLTGPLMSTRMACPALSLESAFLGVLTEEHLGIRMKDNTLLLIGKEHQLRFKPAGEH